MPETPSSMVPLTTQMPLFSLSDGNGNPWSKDSDKQGMLIVFMCNHCPFVIHVDSLLQELHTLCERNNIQMVGINSNDIGTHPADSPENMVITAERNGWTFPYLFDEDQSVARAFHAACTPDAFLYNGAGELFYRGQFDDSRPSGGESNGADVRNAISLLVEGQSPPEEQKPAIGCNIKWKPI